MIVVVLEIATGLVSLLVVAPAGVRALITSRFGICASSFQIGHVSIEILRLYYNTWIRLTGRRAHTRAGEIHCGTDCAKWIAAHALRVNWPYGLLRISQAAPACGNVDGGARPSQDKGARRVPNSRFTYSQANP